MCVSSTAWQRHRRSVAPARARRCPNPTAFVGLAVCLPLQALSQNIAEAYYRLEPFLRSAVRTFVRDHLAAYAENEVRRPASLPHLCLHDVAMRTPAAPPGHCQQWLAVLLRVRVIHQDGKALLASTHSSPLPNSPSPCNRTAPTSPSGCPSTGWARTQSCATCAPRASASSASLWAPSPAPPTCGRSCSRAPSAAWNA